MANAYFTNRGKTYILSEYFTSNHVPANFKLVLCAKQNENNIDNAAAVNKGSGKVGIPVTAHGYFDSTRRVHPKLTDISQTLRQKA